MSSIAGQSSCQSVGASRLSLADAASPARAEIEAFIGRTYARHYGAALNAFLPNLLCLRDADGQVTGALGLRDALGAELFLERYVADGVERVLATTLGRPCDRRGVIEVGNLAAAGVGGTRALIAALTGYLKGTGHDWAVFTAVAMLRNSFQRLGIELVTLAPARIESLPAHERARWGTYYDANPTVVAANVHQSYAVLAAHSPSARAGADLAMLLGLGRARGWDSAWAKAA
jgi:hypothetical protein